MLIFAFDFRFCFYLLAGYATSIDPELRDTFGYEILSTWVHRSGKFSAANLDSLRRQFIPYAREGLGEGNARSARLCRRARTGQQPGAVGSVDRTAEKSGSTRDPGTGELVEAFRKPVYFVFGWAPKLV